MSLSCVPGFHHIESVLKVWCLEMRACCWCYLCKIFDLLDLLPQLKNVPVQAAAEFVDVLIPVAHRLVNSTVKPSYLWPKALCEKWRVWVCGCVLCVCMCAYVVCVGGGDRWRGKESNCACVCVSVHV